MENNVEFTWGYWLLGILVAITMFGFYTYKFRPIGVATCVRGIYGYYKDKIGKWFSKEGKKSFTPSAKAIKEITWCIITICIAATIICYICDFLNVPTILCKIVNSVKGNFTNKYPLLTTIIGAFIALLCDYLFVYPKMYISPDAFFHASPTNNVIRLSWYMENRSIFDCIDIHVDACKCYYKEGGTDLQLEHIKFVKPDIPVLASRFSSSNDRAYAISTENIAVEEIKDPKFDYIEITVKFTHALSRVTKTIVKQYQAADFYNGDMRGDTTMLYAFLNTQAPILTLKAKMLKRFMYARRYITICLTSIVFLSMAKIIFEDIMSPYQLHANAVIVGLSVALIIFAIMRFFYHLPVVTKEDDLNKPYRTKYAEKIPGITSKK